MEQDTRRPGVDRRRWLAGMAAAVAAVAARAQSIDFKPSARYPDPAVQSLDPAFGKYRLLGSTLEQLATGMRWAEGPVWFGDGRFLLVSDIPGNRIMRWDEVTGSWGVFRSPSNHANGQARDRQGRLITCEHLTRRITRTEYDGSITVLADRYNGKRLNSPNDIVCQSNGAIWFTDPPYGIDGWWNGEPGTQELPDAVYRLAPDGKLEKVIDDLGGPNGLAFSPDEKLLYVVESLASPWRKIWAYQVGAGGALSGKRLFCEAGDGGAYDGVKVDLAGNLWCAYGSNGHTGKPVEAFDGVRVIDPHGKPIGHIRLPERCGNLCFGGRHNNRLFMASSHSLYALYVNTQGAV